MSDFSAIDSAARAILRKNDRGGYTIPTDGLYPYQWNWDSAFAALGFARFDPARAWRELETLMAGQWASGMVPHILFHEPSAGYFPGAEVWGCEGRGPVASSGISQPPVAATVARRLYGADPEAGRAHVARLAPRFLAWHRWFMQWRAEEGMICVTHPWESGRDNAPDWDGAMAAIDPAGVGEYARRDTAHVDPHMRPTRADYDRYVWLVQLGRRLGWDEAALRRESPFRVADPTMSFILLRANRDLLALAGPAGLSPAERREIEGWIAQQEAGMAGLWNTELQSYDAFDLRSRRFGGTITNAAFLCWYAGLGNDAMRAHLERILARVEYGVPSTDPEAPQFDPRRYWRGPVWAIMNAMIGIGLEEAGLVDLARRVRSDTARLIAERGFAEYFDPLTGAPAGGGSFTWTAAVWLGWAGPRGRDAGRGKAAGEEG